MTVTFKMKYNLGVLARHSQEHVWASLLAYCRAKGAKHELTADDAEAVYDIVRAEYDHIHKRDAPVNAMARAIGVRRIREAINSGE